MDDGVSTLFYANSFISDAKAQLNEERLQYAFHPHTVLYLYTTIFHLSTENYSRISFQEQISRKSQLNILQPHKYFLNADNSNNCGVLFISKFLPFNLLALLLSRSFLCTIALHQSR